MVEIDLPDVSTLSPLESSKAKSGCREDAWDVEAGSGWARTVPIPKADTTMSSPITMSRLRFEMFISVCLFLVKSSTPFDGVARVAENCPIEPTVLAVTGFALQGIFGGLHHVCSCPVHVGFSEVVMTTVFKACDRRGDLEGAVPVEGCPETALTRCNRLKQVVIYCVIGLLGDV